MNQYIRSFAAPMLIFLSPATTPVFAIQRQITISSLDIRFTVKSAGGKQGLMALAFHSPYFTNPTPTGKCIVRTRIPLKNENQPCCVGKYTNKNVIISFNSANKKYLEF